MHRPQPLESRDVERPTLAPRRRDNPWVRRGLVFATCVVLANALVGERGLAEVLRVRRTFSQSRSSLTALKHENAALREQMRRLLEDPMTIEAVAREELGLVRPGEIRYDVSTR